MRGIAPVVGLDAFAMEGQSSKKPALLSRVYDKPVAAVAEHIFLLGICGAGIRALAEILLDAGHSVTATDVQLKSRMDAHQFWADWGHPRLRICDWDESAAMLAKAGDLRDATSVQVPRFSRVVTSAAVPGSDVRLEYAIAHGVPVELLSAALARCFASHRQICIAGTHGKTTTTGLLWWILESAGRSPSGFVGGRMAELQRSGYLRHSGADRGIAVVESCEYRNSFLSLSPDQLVVTGIDRDHFDCFPTRAEEDQAFRSLVARLPETGKIIVNGDCTRSLDIAREFSGHVITYGLQVQCQWSADHFRHWESGQQFDVYFGASRAGTILLQLPGRHNAGNALAAIAAATETGLSFDEIADAAGQYRGIERRFERRGTWRGMELIDDYAHHPGAIAATLTAARSIFPGRRLVAAFEPHQLSRTEQLFEQFRDSLTIADECLLLPVLPAREQASHAKCCRTSGRLVRAVNLAGGRAFLLANLDQVLARIDHSGKPGDVVITMGAGRTNQIHDQINRRLQRDFVA